MNKYTDKSKSPQVFATQQPKAAQVSTPQQISRPRPVASATLTHEDIARRAYQIYIEKGCPQDQSEEIWLQAEQDIKSRVWRHPYQGNSDINRLFRVSRFSQSP